MNKKKIFNDPVYGFISFPQEILYDLINHPYFQRLRRIAQMGLSHYVYPGALHTRFHHALGSLHLTTLAISVLREKGTLISEEEAEAVSIAILLHDIGHGPFSHALERKLLKVSHEKLSLAFMDELDKEFEGRLTLAISIFKNEYPRKFLNQLVSSQLDMDRMDYLNRDSFFTGVAEGVIGYDRIIKMLVVRNDELLIEEKGIFSIEKFLMARRLMYWQVYLHKTSIIAEQMLIQFIRLIKEYGEIENHLFYSEALSFFLNNDITEEYLKLNQTEIIRRYAALDDYDVFVFVKRYINSEILPLRILAEGLVNRRLFKIELSNEPFSEDRIQKVNKNIQSHYHINEAEAGELILLGQESNQSYNALKNEIKILYKSGIVGPLSLEVDNLVQTKIIIKHYLCYPKIVASL